MTESTSPFRFEIYLTDGQKVEADVGADDFERIRDNNPGWVIPRDQEPGIAAAMLIYSMLLMRVDKGSGETGIRDITGRNWIIPARSIVAFSYKDPRRIELRRIGFERTVRHDER